VLKFGNFVNFSGKYHNNLGIMFYVTKTSCPSPKVDWAPTPMGAICVKKYSRSILAMGGVLHGRAHTPMSILTDQAHVKIRLPQSMRVYLKSSRANFHSGLNNNSNRWVAIWNQFLIPKPWVSEWQIGPMPIRKCCLQGLYRPTYTCISRSSM